VRREEIMADEKTEMSERFIKLHELVDTINVNISYLKANVLDSRESRKVMQQFSELDKLIATLQTELSEVKRKYLEPEYPEQRNRRWKTAPTC
jgi:DNA phosphorothioation-dependent restriction protein DptG